MANVLIVEDDRDTQELLSRYMIRAGHEVRTAGNGWEGLLALEEPPDLILLDIMMPGMDGVTFLHSLRRMREGRGVPVVVVTARDPQEIKARVSPHGVTAVLPKGGRLFDGLSDTVRQILAEPHARQAAEVLRSGELIRPFIWRYFQSLGMA